LASKGLWIGLEDDGDDDNVHYTLRGDGRVSRYGEYPGCTSRYCHKYLSLKEGHHKNHPMKWLMTKPVYDDALRLDRSA
jgi:hypothetical protein